MKEFDDSRLDTSAEERFYNRSIRIRRSVILFLDGNAGGRQWRDIMRMAEECGNSPSRGDMPFSSITAYRWINQFTAPNFAFGLSPYGDLGYQIVRRRPLRRTDFEKWGIPVPKRFRKH